MNSEFYDRAKVCAVIESYCEHHKLNELDFAKLIDSHPTTLSRIKAGKLFSIESLFKIAALGQIEINELFQPIPERVKSEILTSGKANNLPAIVK